MKLRVVRIYGNDDETLGILSIDEENRALSAGYREECFILEDQYQTEKVYGETRIPSGTYKVKLRKQGRMHEKYSKRFPDFHKGMLELQDVPNFKYVYIHIGNSDDDTLGCLLTGRKTVLNGARFKLENSTDAYIKMYKKVVESAENGDLIIQIV